MNIPLPRQKLKLIAPWEILINNSYFNRALIELLVEENQLGLDLNLNLPIPYIWPVDTIFLVKSLRTTSGGAPWMKMTVQKHTDGRFKKKVPLWFLIDKTPPMDFVLA